jgi:hypothetical protein
VQSAIDFPGGRAARESKDGDRLADAKTLRHDLDPCTGRNVLKHIGSDDSVEGLVLKRQIGSRPNDRMHGRLGWSRKINIATGERDLAKLSEADWTRTHFEDRERGAQFVLVENFDNWKVPGGAIQQSISFDRNEFDTFVLS